MSFVKRDCDCPGRTDEGPIKDNLRCVAKERTIDDSDPSKDNKGREDKGGILSEDGERRSTKFVVDRLWEE